MFFSLKKQPSLNSKENLPWLLWHRHLRFFSNDPAPDISPQIARVAAFSSFFKFFQKLFRSGFKTLDHARGQGAGRFESAATSQGISLLRMGSFAGVLLGSTVE
jgi:hypothetical protein